VAAAASGGDDLDGEEELGVEVGDRRSLEAEAAALNGYIANFAGGVDEGTNRLSAKLRGCGRGEWKSRGRRFGPRVRASGPCFVLPPPVIRAPCSRPADRAAHAPAQRGGWWRPDPCGGGRWPPDPRAVAAGSGAGKAVTKGISTRRWLP